MIVHCQVRLVKGAGVAESKHSTVKLSTIYNAAEAQRTVGDEDRHSLDDIVHYLMKVQHIYRVAIGSAPSVVSDDQVVIVQPR